MMLGYNARILAGIPSSHQDLVEPIHGKPFRLLVTSGPPGLYLRLELSAHITIGRFKGLGNFTASGTRALVLSKRNAHSTPPLFIRESLLVIQGIAGATLCIYQFVPEFEFCEVAWRIFPEVFIFLSNLLVVYHTRQRVGMTILPAIDQRPRGQNKLS
jgi:hypothetical protein